MLSPAVPQVWPKAELQSLSILGRAQEPTFPFFGGSILVSASLVWASSRSKLGMVGEADSLHFFPFFLLPSLSFRVCDPPCGWRELNLGLLQELRVI